MRLLRYSGVALCLAMSFGAAHAAPLSSYPTNPGASPPLVPAAAFANPIGDAELGRVHGTGLGRPGSLRLLARQELEAFGRQTATIAQVTFDNWFNDVGAPLIAANLSR